MDFSYAEEQQAILDLAGQILGDGTTKERLEEIERGDTRFDRELWKKLAEAGLVGVAIPESLGGAGLGFLELTGIVEQIGTRAAPVPFIETAVLGALPLNEFGSDAQKEAWLPRVASGEAILTAALVEPEGDPLRPTTRAHADGDGWRLSGTKLCVPAGQLADLVLVPAATGENRVGVFLLDPRVDGVQVLPLDTTTGQPEALIELSNVRVDEDAVLGSPERGREIVAWITLRANAALACLALGVCEEALRLTAEYCKTRKQFDQPIAMFQAVGHRAADAFIDTEGIRLTALQAAWRIAAGKPAEKEVAVAKFWAADAGYRVVHAAQHLHGGIGVDREYPLHRYFLMARQLELTLGGGTQQLRTLGALLAEEDDGLGHSAAGAA
ncbi:MAG: acyl-CoA dehydrogenase family protein [Myxococcota bacterium]|nr:acyl-CoA dehydrogenase family protein [Myxococcota bacterium]